jgi:hypothetical protein
MGDRADTLREEAARCLAFAQAVADPGRRAQLIHMAARLRELADCPGIDFEGIQQVFNESQLGMASSDASPVQQQQQQQQQQPPANAEPEMPAPRPPLCPACGKPMRLRGSEPATNHINFDQLKYACDCGETAEKTVARPE